MKSKFPTDRYFRQCVGIDVSKSKFTACLCMLSWGCPAQFTESIEFANTKPASTSWSNGHAERLRREAYTVSDGAYGNIL